MTALIKERMRFFEKWTRHLFTLASGNKGWKGGLAGVDLSTGKVEPAHPESDLWIIGVFDETIDATLGDKPINVHLFTEIHLEFFASAGGISATNIGQLAYALDDQTVSLTPTGALVGRIWHYDAVKGVGVEKASGAGGGGAVGAGSGFIETSYGAFASNDLVIPTEPSNRAIVDVPTTAGASTITLPAAAADGTHLIFVADGVKNGHAITYRDATGPVVLTTALPALKRHQVHAVYLNGTWTANAYNSP